MKKQDVRTTYSYDGYVLCHPTKEEKAEQDARPTIMQNTTEVVQPSELGEVIRHLNDDSIEGESRMSGIDMKTRLHPQEITQLTAVDFLVSVRFLPVSTLSLTRQVKRLKVSELGKGRQDIVNISSGKKEMDGKINPGSMGMIDKVRNGLGLGGG